MTCHFVVFWSNLQENIKIYCIFKHCIKIRYFRFMESFKFQINFILNVNFQKTLHLYIDVHPPLYKMQMEHL